MAEGFSPVAFEVTVSGIDPYWVTMVRSAWDIYISPERGYSAYKYAELVAGRSLYSLSYIQLTWMKCIATYGGERSRVGKPEITYCPCASPVLQRRPSTSRYPGSSTKIGTEFENNQRNESIGNVKRNNNQESYEGS